MGVLTEIAGRSAGLERVAIGQVAYERLFGAAEAVASALRAAGARPGDLIACAFPHGPENIATFIGARMAGLVLVPLNPYASTPEKLHIVSDSGARFLVAPAIDADGLAGLAHSDPRPFPTGAIIEIRDAGRFVPEPGDEFVIYTSGSTGRPKGVILPEAAFAANIAAVASSLGLGPDDRTVAFTPPSYAMAISQVFVHLWVGGSVLPAPRGLMAPANLLTASAEYGVTGLHLNASIMQMLLALQLDIWPELQRLRYVMLVGQPLGAGLVSAVREALPRTRVVNGYGCTENSPRVSSMDITPDVAPSDGLMPVGYAVAGTEVAIVDESGEPLPPGRPGEIVISGASLMRGYLLQEMETANRIRQGRFHTRDRGFVDRDGRLHVIGRMDNVILVGQEKVSAEEVEEAILAVGGVREAAVGPVSDPLHYQVAAALLVVEGDAEAVVRSIKQHLRDTLSRAKAPRQYFVVAGIPRTPAGKFDRVAIAASLQELALRP